MQKKEYSNVREYESPDFEVVHFDSDDILTTASGNGGEGGGSNPVQNALSGLGLF